MAMVQPITEQETQYVYSLAALQFYADEQGEARHRGAARSFLDAKRNLAVKGEEIYNTRNRGLIEFADVLAAQDDKPQPFLDFMEEQKQSVLKKRGEGAKVQHDEQDNVLVAEKLTPHENQREIVGEMVKIVRAEPEVEVRQEEAITTAPKKRVRTLKKESDRG